MLLKIHVFVQKQILKRSSFKQDSHILIFFFNTLQRERTWEYGHVHANLERTTSFFNLNLRVVVNFTMLSFVKLLNKMYLIFKLLFK